MVVTTHFANIKKVIYDHLVKATKEISVAVCWLTDEDLIRVLWKQQENNIKVQVVIGNVKANFYNVNNFKDYLQMGAKLYVSPSPLMHNKFCVIDDHVVINGSYNWSYTAKDNDENVMILTIDKSKEEDIRVLNQFKVKHKFLCEKRSVCINVLSDLNQFRNNAKDISLELTKIDEAEIKLRIEFEEDVKHSLDKSKARDVFPSPYIIERMILEGGGVQFVKRILWDEMTSNQMKSGFERLEHVIPHAVDCSFEYLVCKDKYKGLFTEEEIGFCKKLMQKYNITVFN